MNNFIKENWFKLVIIAIVLFVFFAIIFANRYVFMKGEGIMVVRCDKLNGDCFFFGANSLSQ